jgi:tyrosyl-tRNA synthetase
MNLKMAAYTTLVMTLASTSRAFSPRVLNRGNIGFSSTPTLSLSKLLSTTTETSADTEQSVSETSTSIYDVQAEALSKVQSPFIKTLRDRGFLHQCTNLEALDEAMMEAQKDGGALPAYLGFDATADSLHVGSLLQIMILRHLQKSGHKPIVLVGGGTSKVGDPTGKDESRVMLNDDIIEKNIQGISKVFDKFLTFESDDDDESSPSDAIMVNNNDWLSSLKYLEFLRDYGTQFTINRMLSFESVKQRLDREAPFSFLEFNYMILQAYDFLELNRRFGAKLQLGGSDQWGNIISGTELGRRCDNTQLFGMTAPLITTSDGKKMGKTAGGAVWLNADRLSEYDYWQFWRNTSDADVIRFMKLFTELTLEEIATYEKYTGADINKAKIVLADEATSLLHGKDCLKQIHETIENMFKKKNNTGGGTDSLPRIFVSADELSEGIRFADLFLNLKLANSKKEARRLIQGGGAKLGEEKIQDETGCLTANDFGESKEVILRAGKKRAGVVEIQ